MVGLNLQNFVLYVSDILWYSSTRACLISMFIHLNIEINEIRSEDDETEQPHDRLNGNENDDCYESLSPDVHPRKDRASSKRKCHVSKQNLHSFTSTKCHASEHNQ